MRQPAHSRRRLLTGLAAMLGGGSLASRAAAGVLTPRASEGPFYPRPSMRRRDTDNDLVRIAGAVREAGGEVIALRGTLRDRAGQPLAGHRVEIWQVDMAGNYMHPRDRRSANFDPAFQGFGHDITDEGGAYAFRTIKPVVYPGRTPHIHVKVLRGRREVLTTQFYIAGHPDNARDGLYRRMSRAEADAVSMRFAPGPDGDVAEVNIIV